MANTQEVAHNDIKKAKEEEVVQMAIALKKVRGGYQLTGRTSPRQSSLK